jgi:hypothetical protein
MKFAWIENDRIRDVAPGNPAELYHPDIAKFYDTEVPDDAANGDGWVNGQLVKPEPPAPVEPPAPTQPTIPLIGPIAFQMLFKVDELVAIDAAKETNAAIRIFWKLLDDPRTDFVDRNLEPVQTMLRNLEAEGLIGAGRAEEILHGSVSK